MSDVNVLPREEEEEEECVETKENDDSEQGNDQDVAGWCTCHRLTLPTLHPISTS